MAEENYQARATQKHLRRSPRKVRLVVDSVRGDSVDKALKKLEFTNKGVADEVAKVVKSAAANIRDKFQEARLDNQDIYVKEIYVDEGATLKRIQPSAMGRAHQIRKRTCHITAVVGQKEEELVN
mgnify:CR=1 FL=1